MYDYDRLTSPQEEILGFAGFWRRLAAFLVDLALLTLALAVGGMVFAFILVVAPNTADKLLTSDYTPWVIGQLLLLLNWLYFAGYECSASQATIGKMMLGIAVTNMNGERLNFRRATLRAFAKLLSAAPIGAGFVMIAFSRRKQALHDRIAGTLVVIRPLLVPPPPPPELARDAWEES